MTTNIPKQYEGYLSLGYVLEEMYCWNCEDYTDQLCKFSTHERDSSDDHFICLKCNYHYYGITGKYEPPYER